MLRLKKTRVYICENKNIGTDSLMIPSTNNVKIEPTYRKSRRPSNKTSSLFADEHKNSRNQSNFDSYLVRVLLHQISFESSIFIDDHKQKVFFDYAWNFVLTYLVVLNASQ